MIVKSKRFKKHKVSINDKIVLYWGLTRQKEEIQTELTERIPVNPLNLFIFFKTEN